MSSITQDLIGIAHGRLVEQIPALAKLKLVARLELRGRGDVQVFRVSSPGPEISKQEPEDARIEVSLPRADFNDLADADLSHWRTAYEHGVVKIGGEPAVVRLLGGVIAKHEARGNLKRVR
ncbi:MAG: hypothetical protein EDQ89_06275 [Acidobacteria bacterium]|nr:MAG: hypothetical protein EDQ89_06275 [Acidobacteriota bacterium]MCL4286285.1 hypothetical protein [Thermoleophilia bacterium]GIK77071.1 MAG: hypothetical protein BroJett022_07610 [Actinomycetes bacterium]